MSVTVEQSVTAKCKPEQAWQKFQKMEEWPWWNRVVGQAKWIEGQPWQRGARFTLELAYPKRFVFQAVNAENAAPQDIVWTVDGGGLRGTMRFRFDAVADGTSELKAQCDLSGWKAAFSGSSIEQDFRKAYEEWLGALKTEAEKIAREEFARS
jgi:hypothetical protein